MDYSIVIPVYFNEGSIPKLVEEIRKEVIEPLKGKYSGEVIFVDDGSGDKSIAKLLEAQSKYSWIKIIELTRNFGQVNAIYAGYEHASGGCVINISADLQDPTKLIKSMIEEFYTTDNELIIGVRTEREEAFYRKATSKLFYWLSKKISFKNLPTGGFDFACVGRKIIDLLLQERDKNPFWQGQLLSSGYSIKWVEYTRKARTHGKSMTSLSKKIKYFIDGMLSYSYTPIRLVSTSGFLIAGCGFVYALIILISKLLGGVNISGWAPIMITILVLSGMQMVMIGILGEYIWRTLDQIRNRPLYIVKQKFIPKGKE